MESVPDGWVKVVFASDPESIRKLGQYAKTRYYGRENYFLATNSIYLEIMPSGVSKASGLHDLCALMSKSMKNTVVIGDYYNDLEIMREAGYAVAVANAPAEVKAAADHVTTCTCAEGAVGEYLYALIDRATKVSAVIAATAAIAAYSIPLKLNILVAIACAVTIGLLVEAVDQRGRKPKIVVVAKDKPLPSPGPEQPDDGTSAVPVREEHVR